jgi:glycogen debranching enzyme
MLANTADTGQTEYNTADATLWLLHAVDRHLDATGDTDLASELVDPLDEVVGGTWRAPATGSGSTGTACSPRAPRDGR